MAEDFAAASAPHRLPGPVADAFELLAKPWIPQVLWILLHQPTHFNELARSIPGLSHEMLRRRLRELCSAGLIERRPGPNAFGRVLYELTPDGDGLREALAEITSWAQERSVKDGRL